MESESESFDSGGITSVKKSSIANGDKCWTVERDAAVLKECYVEFVRDSVRCYRSQRNHDVQEDFANAIVRPGPRKRSGRTVGWDNECVLDVWEADTW